MLPYTSVMRIVFGIAIMLAATACGQTGSLYLPDESVETPVEIRAPAPAPAPAPVDDDKEKKDTQPPGG